MSHARLGCAVSIALLGLQLALPGSSSAFSDPLSFAAPAGSGGGAGRYFTGSPADGYSCSVCHHGGPEADLRVTGLPIGGYVPGASYEIVVDWPDTIDKYAMAAELTDTQGEVAGSVRLPPSGELQAPEFCEPATDMIPAASLLDAGKGRQILSLPDCGAKRARFLWTAPNRDVGPVWFASSSVVSDGKGDADGDGVTDVTRVIGSPSMTAPKASNVAAGCSALPARRGGLLMLGALFVLCSCWRRYRAKHV